MSLRRQLSSFILGLLFCTHLAVAADPQDPTQADFAAAAQLQNEVQFDLAIPLWEKVIARSPDAERVTKARLHAATCHFQLEQFAKSLELLKPALTATVPGKNPADARLRREIIALTAATHLRLRDEKSAQKMIQLLQAEFPKDQELVRRIQKDQHVSKPQPEPQTVAVSAPAAPEWTDTFTVPAGELSSTGRNPYFILEPGHQLVFEDDDERLVITVLNQVKKIDGVETRVVEELETKGGRFVEVSRNFFAISKRTNSVFYFGEEVDMYKNGKIVSHDGAWQSGANGARFGLMMPGQILLGGRHYQEIAPKVAMDRAEIVSDMETVKTPAGVFKNCLKIGESSPLEPGKVEYKYYAPGVGLVQDGGLKLVKSGTAK